MTPTSTNPQPIVLVINLGTQEPRYEYAGEFLKVSEVTGNLADKLASDFLVPKERRGLYEFTKGLLNSEAYWNPEKFSFPITRPAIEHAAKAGKIEKLVVFATLPKRFNDWTPDDPRLNSSACAAGLLAKYLDADASLRGHFDGFDKDNSIHIEVLTGDSLHHYSESSRLVKGTGLKDLLPKDSRIFCAVSSGLPMMNSAIVRYLQNAYKGNCTFFQVEEPEEEIIRRGGFGPRTASAPETGILEDYVYDLVLNLLERLDFDAAYEATSHLPHDQDSAFGLRSILEIRLRDLADLWTVKIREYPDLAIQAPSNDEEMAVFRIRTFLRKADAAFRVRGLHLQGLTALADAHAFLSDLLGAAFAGNFELLTKDEVPWASSWGVKPSKNRTSRSKLVLDWAKKTETSEIGRRLKKLHSACRTLRNNMVHKLMPPDLKQIVEYARSKETDWREIEGGKFEPDDPSETEPIHAIIRVLNLWLDRVAEDLRINRFSNLVRFDRCNLELRQIIEQLQNQGDD
jgi:hypothetical protein